MEQDAADTVAWFEAIFKGSWAAVPEQALPADVADDSREWAARLLADHANPYVGAQQLEQRMFLGRGSAPDRLVTTVADGVLGARVMIYETLQHFVVGRAIQVADRPGALATIRADLLRLFSTEAQRVVAAAIDAAPTHAQPAALHGAAPVLLSASAMPISAITHWFDRISLFWYADALYVDVPKAYAGNATAIFKPGLDWYPRALRDQLGVVR